MPMQRPEWLRRWPVASIRKRLLLALLLPMGLVMVATSPWDFQLAVTPSRQAYDELLLNDAHAVIDQVQWEQGRARFNLNQQAERLLRVNVGDEEYFVVRDAQGRLLGGDDSLPPVTLPAAGTAYRDLSVTMDAGRPKALRMVVVQRGEGDARVVVQVAETLNKRQAAERRILAAMVLPNVLVALLGALLLYLATRLTLSPIEQLAHQVSQRSPNDLRSIELADSPSELKPVLAALNRLFERVQSAADKQQRFHANVAHQLRTPLTGLRTQVELAQMDGAWGVDGERQVRIVAAIDRLTHLIDQLLTLARAEGGNNETLRRVPVDLQQLIESQASALVDAAIARRIDLGFHLARTPMVDGLPVLLAELLRNLVDNALRYCPSGSVVTVSCGARNGQPWLAVEDNGPGIPEDQRALVFRRFHRGSTHEVEGSGLGLAIVQEIAQLHGATVHAEAPAQGPGVRFEVAWPAGQPVRNA